MRIAVAVFAIRAPDDVSVDELKRLSQRRLFSTGGSKCRFFLRICLHHGAFVDRL
jgi:hypothetical protein